MKTTGRVRAQDDIKSFLELCGGSGWKPSQPAFRSMAIQQQGSQTMRSLAATQ